MLIRAAGLVALLAICLTAPCLVSAGDADPRPVLRLLSWNVWFDDESGRERYPRIFRRLMASQADVICLQECTPRFRELLLATDLAKTYQIANRQAEGDYFNLILSRTQPKAEGVMRLQSRMGRTVPWIDLPWEGRTLRIMCIHLESLDQPPSPELRREQMTAILAEAQAPALIIGDGNFGDQDPVRPELPPTWTDAAVVCAQQDRVTYDPERNPLARSTASPGEPARRLDRFFATRGLLFSEYTTVVSTDSDHALISVCVQIR